MNKTLLVMLDRSMWFSPSYEALISDNMKSLVLRHPHLNGQQNKIREPLTFAFSYAQRVFLCTAIEQQLLQHYINSLALYNQFVNDNMRSFLVLKQWIEERRNLPSWDEWIQFTADKKLKSLKELSFSSLSKAQDFFREIYSEDCFKSALTDRGYKAFLSAYQNFQEVRNGILHRGGEYKNGKRIEATEVEIRETFNTAKKVRDQILSFSEWCLAWWLNKATKPFAS
ncbi:MAG: hypothetical protein WCD80_04380 [Desulfobaccales bacterium]